MSSRVLRTEKAVTSNASGAIQEHPVHHAVQFYDDEAFLVETVARHIGSALADNGAGIVIATNAHLQALEEEFDARGIDLQSPHPQGTYFAHDASEALTHFMVEGWPVEARFKAAIEAIISRAEAVRGKRPLAIFGEMVAVLWASGNHDAALRLEQLWNETAKRHSFSLLCAYPMSGFAREKDRRRFFNVCGEHTDINPAEDYPAAANEKRRRRAVANLQRENRALRNEIRLSRERVMLLQRSGHAGTWEMDLLDETFSFSSKAAGMLGLAFNTLHVEVLASMMRYSGDRENFLAALKRATTGRKEFVTEFRIDRNGETRVMCIRGRTYYNHGQPLILGILSDVTPSFHAA